MKNEEQLREEWYSRWRGGEMPPIMGKCADWWLAELHQAELNWLTAQIERGEGMKKPMCHKECQSGEACDSYWTICAYNKSLTDFLSPLIERKKEVESKLDANK